VGAILAQPYDEVDHPTSYASRKLSSAERNYSTTEREALGMVFSLQKFRHYLLANPFTFYTDHQALKYLVNKPLHHGRICRWLLLFQEFEFDVVVRPGRENVGPDHLSRVETGEEAVGIEDELPDAHLFRIEAIPHGLADIAQFLEAGRAPEEFSERQRKILAMKAAPYTLINGFLYRLGVDDVLRRCVLDHEKVGIMNEAHSGSAGGHFQADTMTRRVL